MKLLVKTLRDQRRALLGWTIGTASFSAFIAAYFPSIEAMGEDLQKLIDSYPPAMQAFLGDFSDLATGAGFLRAQLFSLMFPILFLLYAIERGSDLVAGEEERGELDVLLAHPIDRRRVVVEKAGGLALGILVLAAPAWIVLVAADAALGMGVGPGRLTLAMLAISLYAMAMGGVALAVGALRGRKALAIATAAGLAVAAYLLTSLGRLVEALEPLQPLSLQWHYERAHALGADASPVGSIVLALFAGAMLALAAWGLERRDVGV